MCGINLTWLLSLLRHQRPFLVSPFSAGKSSLVSWLAVSSCFPFAPLFPFVYTVLPEDFYPFPSPFLVSTFAGASLADNLADLLLGSSFTTPSAELTFLLGILVAGQARAGCLRATVGQEPSRS